MQTDILGYHAFCCSYTSKGYIDIQHTVDGWWFIVNNRNGQEEHCIPVDYCPFCGVRLEHTAPAEPEE